MKKIIAVMLTSIFLIAGCSGGSKATSKVCTGEFSNETKGEITLEYKDKDVTKISVTSTIEDDDMEKNSEIYKKSLDALKKERKEINFEYKIEGKKLTQSFEIEVDKADLDELASSGMLPQGLPVKDGKLNLDKTVTLFEDSGFKCK